MPEWFRRKSQNIKTTVRKDTKEGMWIKCPTCGDVIYSNLLKKSYSLCPSCNHHFKYSFDEYNSFQILYLFFKRSMLSN